MTGPVPDALRLDLPQIAKVAALFSISTAQVAVTGLDATANTNNKFIEKKSVLFVEPQFFDIFDSKWLSGSVSVLTEPNKAVLSREYATKYFGDWKKAIGQNLQLDNKINLQVAGVVDDYPVNSDIPVKILISYATFKAHSNDYFGPLDNWDANTTSLQVYVLLNKNESVSRINDQLNNFVKKHFDAETNTRKSYFLQPLTDVHFDNRFENLGDHMVSKSTLLTISLIGLFILIMASINFVNFSTAQAVKRSKEIGVRKVLGSTRGQLIGQVMSETILIVLIALVLAVGIAKLVMPYLYYVANVPLSISLLNAGSLVFLGLVIIIVTLLSGSYPAMVLSGFKPALALKSRINSTSVGGISIRRVLMISQFAISQILLIGTIVAVTQMNYVHNSDLGFNKEAILMVSTNTNDEGLRKIPSLREQMQQIPSVQSVSFNFDAPSSSSDISTNFFFNNSTEDPGFYTFFKPADADYFKTFDLKFLAGHGYSPADTISGIVVNETLMKKLNLTDPEKMVGKTIRLGNNSPWFPIIGVVKDFKTNSFREEIKPILIFPDQRLYRRISIKIQTAGLAKAVPRIQELWKSAFPQYAYSATFLDENIARFYKQETQLALAYKIFAALAIFISCLGLYALVSFMGIQKTKEVGIRKVLGASAANIMYIFFKEFTILVVIAFLLAMPVGYMIMSNWLKGFVYRIDMSIWIFLLTILLSLVIAWLTTGYQAIRSALTSPVKSIKTE